MLLLSLFNGVSKAQTLFGKVTDAKSGEGLIGVSIVLDGTDKGTVTDAFGKYKLPLPDNTPNPFIVNVSMIGYVPQKVSSNKNTSEITLDIALKEGTTLGEIMVTANRKSENLQKVPMSISTLSPAELRRNNSLEFRDYAMRIPNLAFGTQGGGGTFNDGRMSNQISIRSIGGANATSFYLDETPLPETIDPRIMDIARVEVLRGPQGTLYGSGSMGGAVKVVTNRPDALKTEGSVLWTSGTVKDGGIDNNIEALYNIPIIKHKVALRIGAFRDYQAGIFDKVLLKSWNGRSARVINTNTPHQTQDLVNDVDAKIKYGFHAGLGIYPTENFEMQAKVIYQNLTGKGYDFADTCACNLKQNRVAGFPESFSDKWYHASLVNQLQLPIGKLISSTSYTNRKFDEVEDQTEFISTVPGISTVLSDVGLFWAAGQQRGGEYKKFVQELRLMTQSASVWNASVGVYYADEKLAELGTSITGSNGTAGIQPNLQDHVWGGSSGEDQLYAFKNDVRTREAALFGELYYAPTDKLKMTLGIRAFDAQKDRTYNANGFILDTVTAAGNLDLVKFNTTLQLHEQGLNPRLIINYEPDNNTNIYASVSRGFRLGGLNDAIPPAFCKAALDSLKKANIEVPKSYKSDYIWTYEVGLKSRLFGDRVILNAAVYYNDWSNLQQFNRLPCGFVFTGNVGRASSIGFETDIKMRLLAGLDLGLGLGYSESKVEDVTLELGAKKGDKLPFAPRLTGNFNAQYAWDITTSTTMYLRADFQYVGERVSQFPTATAADGARSVEKWRVLPAYSTLNVRAGVNYKKYDFAIFGNNVTNTAANFGDINALAAELAGRPRYMRNRPMTVGVSARAFF
jgi:outer membrane receptor protein involved in Fe transport